MKKVKVLQIVPSLGSGGAEKLVLDLTTELSKSQDFECTILTLNATNSFELESKDLKIACIPYTFRPSLWKKDVADVREIEIFIKNLNPDIIHSHLLETDLLLMALDLPPVKIFSHLHNSKNFFLRFLNGSRFSIEDISNYFLRNRMMKIAKKRKQSFIAISDSVFRFHQKNLRRFNPKIHLLENAIQVDSYIPRVRYGIKEPLKCISVGRLEPHKNHKALLTVVESFLNGFKKDIQLEIFGEGSEHSILSDEIDDRGLADHIHLRGLSKNLPEDYDKADIMIHPASWEPFGLVYLEAMASGLPIVTLNNEGARELIRNKHNGLIVDSEEQFATAIGELIDSSELYQEISKTGIKMASEYDITNYVEKLKSIYINE